MPVWRRVDVVRQWGSEEIEQEKCYCLVLGVLPFIKISCDSFSGVSSLSSSFVTQDDFVWKIYLQTDLFMMRHISDP